MSRMGLSIPLKLAFTSVGLYDSELYSKHIETCLAKTCYQRCFSNARISDENDLQEKSILKILAK